MRRLAPVVGLALAVHAFDARAQFGNLLDRARQRAENATLDAAEKAARKAASGEQQREPVKSPPAHEAAPAQTATKGDDKGQAAPAPMPPGEVYGNRFDFVPGDKVLVFDDFADTDVGEFPARWTLKDGGGGNPVEVVEIGGRRFLKARFLNKEQKPALQWLRYDIKGDMPKDFTIELDADIAGPISFVFSRKAAFGGQEIVFNQSTEGAVRTTNVKGKLPVASEVQHVSIAVSGTQAKVYVGGERVVADPDAITRPITRLGVYFYEPYRAGDHQMFTNLRIAEGGKPARQMLAGEGRIITHGILFDTGSDVIKPESGPTLRTIQALLAEDPGLSFSIEGHTDNQGGTAINGPLSERRAAAVKAWLVKQGIDAKRLTAKGFGDTKPIDGNATAEGRANNRRVEFVRMEPRAAR